MKRYIIILTAIICATLQAVAQEPLYIVNGVKVDAIKNIPPTNIERVDMLPADEQTIAKYGPEANNGVMLIVLKYDTPAIFGGGDSFSEYVAERVKWDGREPAARVVLRYKILPDGQTLITDCLESTESRLKRRVLKVIEESPRWQPAKKSDVAVESEGVLRIQLPKGKTMPKERYVVLM